MARASFVLLLLSLSGCQLAVDFDRSLIGREPGQVDLPDASDDAGLDGDAPSDAGDASADDASADAP